nr:MAG TPA: hypothetical protein [Caudoviricetes sp.]
MCICFFHIHHLICIITYYVNFVYRTVSKFLLNSKF